MILAAHFFFFFKNETTHPLKKRKKNVIAAVNILIGRAYGDKRLHGDLDMHLSIGLG